MAKTTKSARRAKSAGKKSKKGAKKAKGRVSFTKVWEKIGNRVLKSGVKDRGWNKKALVSRLATDIGLQQLVVERIVRLLPGTAASEVADATPAATAASPRGDGHEVLADEYACSRAAAHLRETVDAEAPAQDKADWRIF
jgi:hypothetical protein